MKIWGTSMFAQLRLIIRGRALSEHGGTQAFYRSNLETTDVDDCGERSGAAITWLQKLLIGLQARIWSQRKDSSAQSKKRYAYKRGLRLLLTLMLLGIGVAMAMGMSGNQSVAAATFNTTAYNRSSQRGTWYVYPSADAAAVPGNLATASASGGANAYLDTSGTLHVAAASSGTALGNMIPATGSTWSLSDVKAISFEGKNILVDNSIGLFQSFPNLEKITGLDNLDVSRMTTLNYLFSAHKSGGGSQANTNALITTIEGTGNWDTSHVTSMDYTFEDQPNLTSVDGIQNWDTSKVTSMVSLFYLDKSLAKLPDLSGWNTSKVTNTSYAFGNMDALTSVDSILNWQMQSNTNIQGMFQNDPQLKFGGRFNWDTSKVVYFLDAFMNDTGATSLDLSDWDVSAGDDFSQMFRNMSGLTSLDVTGWQPTNATQLGFMFHGDAKLTTLPGIDGWTLSNAADATDMLSGMTSVTELPVSKWQLRSGSDTNITNMFWGDNALTNLDVSGWHIKSPWTAGDDNVFPTYDYSSSTLQSQLKSITFGKNWTGKVVLPQFKLSAANYGVWRGENHDKDNVTGAGAAKETYTPPSTAANRVETFRFAYDIIAKIVNSKGEAMTLADVPITVKDSAGTAVLTAQTGADGTVTLPMNSTGGDFTAELGDLPAGYSASTATVDAKIVDQDVQVTFVVDEQNDADLVDQYPHAGGTGTLFSLVAGILAIVAGTVGIAYVKWQS